MTVKLAPELTKGGPPKSQAPRADLANGPQKRWLTSNFKLEIDGLDTNHVVRVDPFAVRQTFVSHAIGELRDSQREPTSGEVPNLRVTLATGTADTWIKWHDDFLVKGNNGADKVRGGTLRLLAPDLKEIARIDLKGLGIFRLTDVARGGRGYLAADLYCTAMALHVGGPQANAPVQQTAPSPTATASPSPSAQPTVSPTPSHPAPSASVPATPSPTPTAAPSVSPSHAPSAAPSVVPSASPSPSHRP